MLGIYLPSYAKGPSAGGVVWCGSLGMEGLPLPDNHSHCIKIQGAEQGVCVMVFSTGSPLHPPPIVCTELHKS